MVGTRRGMAVYGALPAEQLLLAWVPRAESTTAEGWLTFLIVTRMDLFYTVMPQGGTVLYKTIPAHNATDAWSTANTVRYLHNTCSLLAV
jgi:hypothetical protein